MAERRAHRSQLSKQFIVFIATFVGCTIFVFSRVIWMLSGLRESAMADHLPEEFSASLRSSMIVMGVAMCALVLAALAISALLTQRIFATKVPLKRFISKLQVGEYTARGSLRKGDEFKDVMEDLNGLAEALEKRHP